VAEALLLVAAFAVPLLAGAAAVYVRRPWWWGGLVAVLVFLVAAIAPEPEEGESRLVWGDLGFLLVVAVLVLGLAWLGAWLARRLLRARG
jgi:hypothetical protein